jgi:hypothetical protein
MKPLILFALWISASGAQALEGVIDLHTHSDPDIVPRSIDGLSLVRLAKQRGLRGIVLKNHYEPTVSMAFLARREVPVIEVFGGIALNRAVGGVNPAAVERFAKVKGGLGKIVWMPTFDAEHQVRSDKTQRPFVAVSRGGKLLPEVLDVIDLIAKYHLVLATGHSSPVESLMLIREAGRRGVKHVVVTHPLNNSINMSLEQMKQAAALGAMLEFVGSGIYGQQKEREPKDFSDAMRAVGYDRVILASDFGQAGNPLPPDGLEIVMRLLRAEGVPAEAIERMTRKNPAVLLGLE